MLTELSRAQLLEKRKSQETPKAETKVEKAETVAKTETAETTVKKSVPENKNVKRNAKEAEG